MKNLPLVSIALCTYNGEKYLAQQLDTLVNQTYRNIEIIAVDDLSTDKTFNILTEYAVKYPQFFIYRNEKNLGFQKNFEAAALYCKGEFIAFCDQDDVWHPQKIELMMASVGNSQLIYHDSEFIGDNGKPIGKKMSDVFNFYRGDQAEVFLLNNCISSHAMLIRKEVLQYALPLKENYFHDWWLAYVAANMGIIDFMPQSLVQYRQHSENNTDLLRTKDKKNHTESSMETSLLAEARWLEHCLNFPKNKNPAFVKMLYDFFTSQSNSFINIRYWLFLRKNMDLLFFIVKKNKKWKEREIRKNLWGLRGKNLWYTYIRPDKKKILDLSRF